MAASISLTTTNILSFLSPSNPPPKTSSLSPHLSLSHQNGRKYKALIPLVAHEPHSTSLLSPELNAVMYPSVANANTLYFKSAYNVQVIVDENEPEERLLNRFRREVMRAGVIQECKRRRFFENTQDEKKRKSREAAKRNRRRRPQSRYSPQNRREMPTTKKEEEDDDNWELPEGDLPY